MSHFDPDFLAHETLRLLGPDPQNWVPDQAGIDHNVAVIGGGHTGSAFAFALRRAGIGKVTVLDQAVDESQSGIWRTIARMNKLRTPKNLVGPELGYVGLGFQAWYEARHGQEAYAAIDRIAREDWADYIAWYRKILNIGIRYGTRLERLEPVDDHFRLHLTTDGKSRIETARKVILANGFPGSGGAFVPDKLAHLPATHLAHTHDPIDFAKLKGRIVAVVGGAASAFDAAAIALESDADAVHLFSRRPLLAATAINKVRAYPGAYDNFPDLPDRIRWHQAIRYRRAGTTAPPDSVERVTRHPNFHIHLGGEWESAQLINDKVAVTHHGDSFDFDFVIAGTGYIVDLAATPELRDFANQILLWRDRFTPASEEADDSLARHPYLGRALELQEREPSTAPFLRNIHVFNPAAFASHGLPIGDVPSMRRDIPAVVAGISRDLFIADLDAHEKRMTAAVDPDFGLEFYENSVWRRPSIAAE